MKLEDPRAHLKDFLADIANDFELNANFIGRFNVDGKILHGSLLAISRLSKWNSDFRAIPNPLVRSALFCLESSRVRKYLDNITIASTSNYKIIYTGFELGQSDLSVLLSILTFGKDIELGSEVQFSAYQVIKDLGWSINKASYQRLKHSIELLRIGYIRILSSEDNELFVGTIINDWHWKLSCIEIEQPKWWVCFNPNIAKIFLNDMVTLLSWPQRKKLGSKKALAQWLHAFYSTHKSPLPYSIKKYWGLTGSHDSVGSFASNIIRAHEALLELKYIESYEAIKENIRITKFKGPAN